MMNNLNCSKYNPASYSGKKLIIFENERRIHPLRLSTQLSSDGKNFTLIGTAVGVASIKEGNENQIAVVEKPIDEMNLRMMEKPNSRFLNSQCDFVLYVNSPRRKAQFTEQKLDIAVVA